MEHVAWKRVLSVSRNNNEWDIPVLCLGTLFFFRCQLTVHLSGRASTSEKSVLTKSLVTSEFHAVLAINGGGIFGGHPCHCVDQDENWKNSHGGNDVAEAMASVGQK